MKALEKFLKDKNHWNSFFKGPQYTLNSAKDRQAVADMIDSALSPENLTCDGELSRTEVNRRYKELMTAAKQLKKFDPEVTFYEYGEEGELAYIAMEYVQGNPLREYFNRGTRFEDRDAISIMAQITQTLRKPSRTV